TTYLPDEITDLATTFNSLSNQIQSQIETLTYERNGKEAILEALAEGVIAIEGDSTIAYANEMGLTFLGLTKEAIGQKFSDLYLPETLETILRQAYEEKKCLNSEIQLFSYHLNVIASPMKTGQGAILVLQDKTIHYKILEMRKEFIANASHELKTPITVIRGFAETLHDNPTLDPTMTSTIMQKIVNNCLRMTKIIQNLLTLADIEHLPQFRLQPCNLESLVEQSAAAVAMKHPDAHIHIDVEHDIVVEADPELLEVAISNLIDNAAKYSKEKAEISVRVEKFASTVKLHVTDNGIGIPEADLPHVFQRFYTVNKAESKKRGGSGLGLSIVETIVKKHHGSVKVSSQVGVGTTFTIQLPNDKDCKQVIDYDQRNNTY
ncbi:MAG TPA: ATP-binding protein, partial [Chlamydiales bacterium]|nr:ATP-binding protein [Chlamydiales bacterium]